MSSRARGLTTNAALALVGDAAAKGGMLVALLLLAHALPVDQFARLGVAMAAMLVLTALIDGGVGVVATREGAAQPSRRRGLLRAGMVARAPLLAAAAVGCLAEGALSGRLELAGVVLLTAFVNALQLALFALFRSAQTLVVEALAKMFCGLSYPVCAALVDADGHRSAIAALLAMTVGPALTLPPLIRVRGRVLAPSHAQVAARALLRSAAPFGLIALATLVYYRAPLLLMGLLSSDAQTASYSVAANLAFGLLMLPAAFATGLLPRLAAEPDPALRARALRRSLLTSTAVLGTIELGLGAAAPRLVPLLYGSGYRDAVTPFLILLGSALVIGAAGILGTALVAADRRRTVVTQVVVALAVNLVVSLIAIPRLGADGAALATLVTELLSFALLAAAYVGRGRADAAPARRLVLAR